MTLADLVARWRSEAELLRRRGAGVQADVLAACAEELEIALREWELEQLTPTQAAAECGYTPGALRKLFPGQRAIPRGALPRKARHPGPADPERDHRKGSRVAQGAGGGQLGGGSRSRRSTPSEEEP